MTDPATPSERTRDATPTPRVRRKKRKDNGQNTCALCGYPIAASADICGECACEDDSE